MEPNSPPEITPRGVLGRWYVRALLVVIAIPLLWLLYEVYLPHTAFGGEKEIEIPPGHGSRMIGGLLREQGVIQSKWAFVTYATVLNRASDLKPGKYTISERESIYDILPRLVRGDQFYNEYVLVIPEGWDLSDIGGYLEMRGIMKASDLWKVTGAPPVVRSKTVRAARLAGQFSFIATSSTLEGYLFPDTYRVYKTATAEDIVKKMLENFARRVQTPGIITDAKRGAYDVIRMASMLEREVKSDEDRRIVAGILWKRLALGIPLQVDATILYLRQGSGPITARDKTIDSPYNTYRYRGLPIGPISNPGISALEAATHPVSSPYLYYLSAPDGRTIFSRTLEEHNAAKAKYLR